MIKVSIIIPVFNSAYLIEQTILSVLKQEYKHWEMIVVDDGSSDNIADVMQQYSAQDDRIKFFRQQNAGASAARNAAIKNANNGWLLFLDADDWIREDYFEKMVAFLENDPSIDVVHCGWTRVSKDGSITKENFGGDESDMFPKLAHYCPFAIHSCIVRKKIVEEIGGFDTSFKTCGDWDVWQRVARTGAKFGMVKETMAFYRTTSNSLSSDGTQFCINGLQAISNAHSFDSRVPVSKPEYVNGLKADDLAERKYYFVAWSAGLLIGSSKPALHLLEHLKGLPALNLNADVLFQTIIDSVIIPAEKERADWISHWRLIETNLINFLTALEKQSGAIGITETTTSLIERYVILQTAHHFDQTQIGNSYAKKINIEAAVTDEVLPNNTKQFFAVVYLKEKLLGTIKLLQLTEKLVPASLIKDAIAAKLSWQILQYFFSKTVYPFIKIDKEILKQQLSEQALHDKIGWKTFLQQLWHKHDWNESMFYDPSAAKKESRFVVAAVEKIQVEIGKELPTVQTTAPVLNIDYYIGGVKAGTCSCEVRKKLVFPQMLRAAINSHAGYELCRIAVREALIGRNFGNGLDLRERLKSQSELVMDILTS